MVVSIGPATTKRIEPYGIKVGMESKVHTMALIVEDLIARHNTDLLVFGSHCLIGVDDIHYTTGCLLWMIGPAILFGIPVTNCF